MLSYEKLLNIRSVLQQSEAKPKTIELIRELDEILQAVLHNPDHNLNQEIVYALEYAYPDTESPRMWLTENHSDSAYNLYQDIVDYSQDSTQTRRIRQVGTPYYWLFHHRKLSRWNHPNHAVGQDFINQIENQQPAYKIGQVFQDNQTEQRIIEISIHSEYQSKTNNFIYTLFYHNTEQKPQYLTGIREKNLLSKRLKQT